MWYDVGCVVFVELDFVGEFGCGLELGWIGYLYIDVGLFDLFFVEFDLVVFVIVVGGCGFFVFVIFLV